MTHDTDQHPTPWDKESYAGLYRIIDANDKMIFYVSSKATAEYIVAAVNVCADSEVTIEELKSGAYYVVHEDCVDGG